MALSDEIKEYLDAIILQSTSIESPVLFLLHKLQDRYGMINPDHVRYISDSLGRPYAELYSVATFYDEFKLNRQGRYIIKVCRGISCHSRGSGKLIEAIKQRLDIEDGETTRDGLITLDGCSCIGQCDGAPSVMINGEVHRNLDEGRVLELIESLIRKGGE
jgi:NADH-quinone oxidoreductase subunit E